MKFLKNAIALLLVLMLGGGLFIVSGLYNMGADRPHWKITAALIQILRERSLDHYSAEITVPTNLNDPQLILKGAGQYAEMCSNCHLAPGKKNSELRAGLYPLPPNLSKLRVAPREAFWVIKHGLKMSAMPAWGSSHDDETIWSMVAFLQQLPGMTPEQYKEIVAKAPPDDDMGTMDGDAHAHDEISMPGAAPEVAAHGEHAHSAAPLPDVDTASKHSGHSHVPGTPPH